MRLNNIKSHREIEIARDILTAYLEHGLPDDMDSDNLSIEFNEKSGCVFLHDNNGGFVAILEEGKLVQFYSTPYHGLEGTIDTLLTKNNPDDLNAEDVDYIRERAKNDKVDLSEYPAWSK